jgi:arsenate reductase (glutaredoxin)
MKRLTVYEKPTCTTCRRLAVPLTERRIDSERIDYMAEPLTESQLRALLQKAGLRPRDVVRTKEPGARELPMEDDEATLRALSLHPELLERPIVECDDRALLARPPEKALELVG